MDDGAKALILANSSGEFEALSAEEAMGKRVNNWKGWRCSAGVDNIHVTPDGNIWSATCKVGGYLGNVYDDYFKIPDEWVACTKEWCMCGSDMRLRKARTLEFKEKTYEPHPSNRVERISSVDWIAPFHFEAHRDWPKTITWDLQRRCNFSCSYCHPAISNNYEAHKSWGSLKHATDLIFECFAKGQMVKWVFTGGEPTLNPAYLDLVKYIRSFGHMIHTQSNGSRGPAYFSELIEYSCVGLSLHFESLNEARFIETCRAVIGKKSEHEEASKLWFGVRLMVPPGRGADAMRIRDELLAIPRFAEFSTLNMSPLYQRIKQDQLMEYESTELDLIIRHA